jgi:DNA transformation protein
MAVSREYMDFVADAMAGIGDVRVKRMFGGAGVFKNDLMFALIAGDGLYFKVDDSNVADYEALDLEPFSYTKNNKVMQMSYRRAPEEVMDDRDEMMVWADKAYRAARAAKGLEP